MTSGAQSKEQAQATGSASSPSAPVLALHEAVAVLSSTPPPPEAVFSLAYVSLATRLAAAAAAGGIDPAHVQLLTRHWPAMSHFAHAAATATATSNDPLSSLPAMALAGARAVTAALHLTALDLSLASSAPVDDNNDPKHVLSLWIRTRAYDLPLFYASIKLHCDAPPPRVVVSRQVWTAMFASPTPFPTPMLALRWLYLWSKLAEPWPPRKRVALVSALLGAAPPTGGVGGQLAHLAATGILAHLPSTSSPPEQLTRLMHSLAVTATTQIDAQVLIYTIVFLAAPRTHVWPALTASQAMALAPLVTHTLCTHVLPSVLPSTRRDPMAQLWLPLLGPLGHLAGATLPHAPSLLPSVTDAFAALHPQMLADPEGIPQSLLFLAVMLAQDVLGPHTLPASATLLALVHPLTLKLAGYVPGAAPFPSYADVLADLTAMARTTRAVETVCAAVLDANAGYATRAFLATWVASDPGLMCLAPTWVLDRLASGAGEAAQQPQTLAAAPPTAPLERVAWEAAHWLVVQVMERATGQGARQDACGQLARVARAWWPWYVDLWWPDTGALGARPRAEEEHAIRWRATAALAAAIPQADNNDEAQELCAWLVERVGGQDLVALCVLVNALPRGAVRGVMRKVEQMDLTKDLAAAVVEQWDRVGGLRWDRAVEVARWWNRVVASAGLV